MAQQALGSGTTQTRGRAFFGLLDASGWAWASLKAAVWFVLLIFMLGYLPDRAYYFTVNKTIDLGILAWAPINFCPEGNQTLPCPPPTGAVVPWQTSPTEIDLPQPRTDGAVIQSGTTLLYIGGSDGKTAQNTTYVSKVSGAGNFDKWTNGPNLPQPRSDAGVVYSGGKIYVVGGFGADGKATTTTYVLTPNAQTGELGEWQTSEQAKVDLGLPAPLAGAVLIAGSDGLFLIGGTDGTRPGDTVYKSKFDKTGLPGKWTAQPGKLFTPVTDASAAIVGAFMWVYGGSMADGTVTATVQRGQFGVNDQATQVIQFGVANGKVNLPAPRADFSGFAANGNLYAVGGTDGKTPQRTVFWGVPTSDGNIPEWKNLATSDLPETGNAGGAPLILGPNAIVIAGTNTKGVSPASLRANIAPSEPYFQLGLFGATVPALKIDGEIGQQLGYLAANTVGIINFALFVAIGVAWAHRPQIREWRDRRRREKELKARL